MLLAIASHGDASVELDAIMALVPLLEHRATEQQSNPAIRSVYAGAATRIREVRLAEAQSSPAHDDVDDDDTDDDDVDDDVIALDEDDDITAAT